MSSGEKSENFNKVNKMVFSDSTESALTKVAIFVTAISGLMIDWPLWSGGTAFMFIVVGLVVSFMRDSWMQSRGQGRMLPGYGVICLMATAVLSVPMFLMYMMIGRAFLGFWETIFCAGITSAFVRLVSLSCEGFAVNVLSPLVDPFFNIFGFNGNKWNNSGNDIHYTLPYPEPIYSNFVPPPTWGYQCPVCHARLQYSVDICWNCNYGANQVVEPTNPTDPQPYVPVEPRGQ